VEPRGRVEDEWGPQVGRFAEDLEPTWQNAHDIVRRAVEHDVPSNDGWVAPKPLGPQRVAEDRDHLVAGYRLTFLESPSDHRADAEDIEQVGRDAGGGELCRFTDSRERHPPARADRRDSTERLRVVLQEEQFGVRDELFGVERHEALGRAERQRTQQDPPHGAEDRGVRPDAEREGENRDEGEAGSADESTNRVPNVTSEGHCLLRWR
jgi:hypothetical protein